MELAFAPRRAFSHEQIARYFFARLVNDNDESTGQWRCKICTRSYRQEDGRGYSNLIAHLRARHPDYEERLRTASVTETGSLLSWVSQRAHTRFGWISWVVEEGLPFTFCEKPATRRNTKLAPISHVTLRDNVLRVTEAVEARVAREIPAKFGIIFDGWSNDSEHFLAVYATYDVDGVVKTPLLSLAPIVNEPDDNLNAESHRSAIESVLQVFGKELAQCVFLVGDNCSVNKKLARLMAVPLVGCASHRLNLAVRMLTVEFQAELDLIQRLMVRLRTLNQASKLRFKTHLRPVLRQDTRWSSTYAMLARFFELREHLDADDEAIAELLPSPSTVKKLKGLLDQMKMVESVSKRIQSSEVTMWEVRALFDALMQHFPVFAKYLDPTASIIGDPHFESAIVKLQGRRPLTRQEKGAVSMLKVVSEGRRADDASDGFAERVLKRARVCEQSDEYILVAAVLPTSNIVERLFSMARAMIGLERHSLQPIMLEALLFLKVNNSYWDVHVVHDVLEEE